MGWGSPLKIPGWPVLEGWGLSEILDDSEALMSVFLSLEKQGRAVFRQEGTIIFSRDTGSLYSSDYTHKHIGWEF